MTSPPDRDAPAPGPTRAPRRHPTGHQHASTPRALLERAAATRPTATCIVDADVCHPWSEVVRRCRSIALGLRTLGLRQGEVLLTITPARPALIEAHYAAALGGFVIVALPTDVAASVLSRELPRARAWLADPALLHRLEAAQAPRDPGDGRAALRLVDGPARDGWRSWTGLATPTRQRLRGRAVGTDPLYLDHHPDRTEPATVSHRAAADQAVARARQLDLGQLRHWSRTAWGSRARAEIWALVAACGVNVCLPSTQPLAVGVEHDAGASSAEAPADREAGAPPRAATRPSAARRDEVGAPGLASALLSHPAVADVAVHALQADGDSLVHAVFVAFHEGMRASPAELEQWSARAADAAAPRRVFIPGVIPATPEQAAALWRGSRRPARRRPRQADSSSTTRDATADPGAPGDAAAPDAADAAALSDIR